MNRSEIVLACIAVVALSACKNSSASAGGDTTSGTFTGVWTCTSDSTVHTAAGDKKSSTALTITISGSGKTLSASAVRTNDGKTLGCTTTYDVNGTTMIATPNQTCSVKAPYGNADIEQLDSTLESAVAHLSGDGYTETYSSHFKSRVKGTDQTGTVNGMQTCTRKK